MRNLLLLVISLFTFNSFSQQVLWTRNYPTYGENIVKKIEFLPGGDLVVAADVDDKDRGRKYIVLQRLTRYNQVVWSDTIQFNGFVNYSSMAFSDSMIYLSGNFYSVDNNPFVIGKDTIKKDPTEHFWGFYSKIDQKGNFIWSRPCPGKISFPYPYYLYSDKPLLITSTDDGTTKRSLSVINESDGSVIKQRFIDGEFISKIWTDKRRIFIYDGMKRELAILDTSGVTLKTISSWFIEDITFNNLGEAFIVGHTYYDCWLAKINDSLNIAATYSIPAEKKAFNSLCITDSNIVLLGQENQTHVNSTLFYFDFNCNLKYSETIDILPKEDEAPTGISYYRSDFYVFGRQEYKGFLSRVTYTRSLGTIPISSEVRKKTKVYPNPSTGRLLVANTYGFLIKELEVTDMLGRVVYREQFPLIENLETPVNLKLKHGLYILKLLSIGGDVETHPVLLNGTLSY